MFDNPFDFAAIVIAIVAFIFARKAMNQAAALRTRLDLMQKLAADRAVPPPPLTQVQTADQVTTPSAPVPPPIIPEVESIAPAAAPETAPQAVSGPAAAPPPPDRGFEE